VVQGRNTRPQSTSSSLAGDADPPPHRPHGYPTCATRPGWSLELDSEQLRPAATAAARIDLVDIVTAIGVDGTLRTEATYTVRNRELQFLRVRLPGDATLWRATLDGAPVVVSSFEGVLQVALKHLGVADLDLVVGLVYEQPRIAMPSYWSSLRLEAPVLVDIGDDAGAGRISVNRTLWRVELPGGYSARLADGNMHEVVSSIEFASKVDANIREIERLSGLLDASGAKSASEPGAPPASVFGASRLNRRQRDALEGNLKKLQQQLDDNAIDLEQTSRDADRIGDRQQIERGLIEQQKAESLDYLQKARTAQQRLEGAIRQSEGLDEASQSASQQAFEDQRRFRGNDWIDNRALPGGKQAARDASRVDLDALVEGDGFAGWQRGARGDAETGIETAQSRTVEGGGLAPLPAATTKRVSPALETPPPSRSTTGLTFRTNGGEVELLLRVQKDGVGSRFASLAALLVAAAIAAGLFWRRRGR